MVLTTRTYTADELWRMPGDEPWELWDGELRKVCGAGAEASSIAGTIAFLMWEAAKGVASITGANGGYILSRDPDTVLVPDVAVVRWERWPDRKLSEGWGELAPDLVVEVESPTYLPPDLGKKRDLYARAGVPLLWWVDPAARTVTIHRPDQAPVTLSEADTLDGADVLPGLSIPVAEIFA